MTPLETRTPNTSSAFREMPFMGVIWVVHEASQLGFVNGRRRGPSPNRQRMRFSFGPPMQNLEMGLDGLERMVRDA